MLTIGFDSSALDPKFKAHAQRGIGRYVSELGRFFQENPSDLVSIESFDHRMFKDKGFVNSIVDYLPAGKQTIRQQVIYPFRLKHHKKIDFFHFPAHMDAPSWSLKNYILTVLDLIPLVLSDLYKANKPGWRFNFARWLEIRAIKNASLILAISENTAKDLEKVLKIPREKIVVTPLGVNEEFFIELAPSERVDFLQKLGLPLDRPIVLYVGGIDPRKNYQVLIRAFSALCERFVEQGRLRPVLALAGGISGDREYGRLKSLIEECKVGNDICELGFVSNQDLPLLYAASTILFFPSLYEGFGLTPLEAMAAGTPVVSSNTSCMPEVLGKAALMIDPTDIASCSEALFEALTSSELRKVLSNEGRKNARKFPWSRTGERTMAAYELMVSMKGVANV